MISKGVIGNELKSRRTRIYFISKVKGQINNTKLEVEAENELEIEELLVQHIIELT